MSNLVLVRVPFDQAPNLTDYKDHTIFQTKEWLDFISHTQNAEPIVALVKEGNCIVGRYTGLIIEKYGVKILGSPFPGWTTSYMGFNLDLSVSKVDALIALSNFAFKDLKCKHIEIMDRFVNSNHFKKAGYNYDIRTHTGFEIDLTKDEDILFDSMTSACRRCIRKSVKSGVKIDVANDNSFADDYYSQLIDVFAKQSLVPTYPIERVKALIKHIHPTGNLLLLRAKNSKGKCIATGIFPALNNTMYFWGGASWRQNQSDRPNEAIQWFAMRYWKKKGIQRYDMGGGGEYKRKYGGYEVSIPWGRKSRHKSFEHLRNSGKFLVSIKQRLKGIIRKI